MPTDYLFISCVLLVSHLAVCALGYLQGRAVWRRGLPPSTRRAMDMARKRQSMRIVSDRPEVGSRLANVRVVNLTPDATNRLNVSTVQVVRSIESDDEPTDVGPKPGSAA